MSKNLDIKRVLITVAAIVVVAALGYTAVLSEKFASLISGPSFIFVLVGGVAVTLMAFSGSEITTALKHAIGGSAKSHELQQSAYFWEALARNFWMVGVLDSLIIFIIGLGSSKGGVDGIATRMTNSYLSTIYGVILAVICVAPALKISGKFADSLNSGSEKISSVPPGMMDKSLRLENIFGYALFILSLGGVFLGSLSSLTSDSPLNPASVFLYWPSLLIVAGGTIVLVLFIGGAAIGQSFTLSLALTGFIGTLVGYYLLLQGFLNRNIQDIAGAITYIISSCFFALLGMIFLGAPLGDRVLKHSRTQKQGTLNRVAWFIFPLITLIFLTLSFVLVLTPIKRAG